MTERPSWRCRLTTGGTSSPSTWMVRFSVRRCGSADGEAGEGQWVVNITSVHEHTPLPDASAYTAAKHALGGLTKSMAMELVKHKILVNARCAGCDRHANEWHGRLRSERRLNAGNSLARPGAYERNRQLVVWLCSTATPAIPPGNRLSLTGFYAGESAI